MKKLLVICMVMAVAVSASAQEFNWGVKAGLNISTITGLKNTLEDAFDILPGVSSKDIYKPGFHVGVMTQCMFDSQIGIETGLYYSMLGSKLETKIPIGGGYYIKQIATMNPSYLQLPISFLYKFDIGTDLQLYPSIGVYLGYGIGGKAKMKFDSNLPQEAEQELLKGLAQANIPTEADFFDEDINKFDFGLNFGLNLQYQKFTIGLGYDLGLTKLNKDSEVIIKVDANDPGTKVKDMKNGNFKVSLGYFF